LDDDVLSPRYIKTEPRLGYRFIASVSQDGNDVRLVETRETQGGGTSQPSIAVLPFANLNEDPGNDYLSDGLTDDIINVLAQIGSLRVIARTSSFAFKGKNEDVRKIGASLGVANLLEGSVQRSAEHVRVTIKLLDATDGSHRWSKRYDRKLTNVFELQDELSADVAQQLRVHLGLVKQATRSVEAYQAYLEGRFNCHKYTPPAFAKASACFERAIALDPDYGSAYSGIAQCVLALVTEGGAPALELLPKASAAASHALRLNGSDSEAHAGMGQIAAIQDYDWTRAQHHFERALELGAPTYSRIAFAMWYLIPRGRHLEAAREADRIIENDPLHLIGHQIRATAFMFAGECDKASEICLRILELDESFPRAVQCLSLLRGLQRNFEESIQWAVRLTELVGRGYTSLYNLGLAHAVAGHFEAARSILAELETLAGRERRAPSRIGLLYAHLGDLDTAFFWVNRALEQRDPWSLWMNVSPGSSLLRSDPRFPDVLRRLNLQERSSAV
jgi:serine/threonine-protein kinase